MKPYGLLYVPTYSTLSYRRSVVHHVRDVGGNVSIVSAGRPTTLRELLRTHVPLLFPPPPSVPLAYAIIQGVVTPGDAEIAWLNACLAGVDGWLSIFVGIGIVES